MLLGVSLAGGKQLLVVEAVMNGLEDEKTSDTMKPKPGLPHPRVFPLLL